MNWNSGPDEVILEVVSRLSLKFIIQMKCVCKRWLHLISTSNTFIRYLHDFDHHRLPRKNNQFVILWNQYYGLDSVNEVLCFMFKVVDVLSGKLYTKFDFTILSSRSLTPFLTKLGSMTAHSSHGLVCLCRRSANHICLFNPTTREFVDIPKSPSSVAKHPAMIGLGYVSSSNQYKIVRWFFPLGLGLLVKDQSIGCEIFTLMDGSTPNSSSWRPIVHHLKFNIVSNHMQPLCVNGVIYWLVAGSSKIITMLVFDLEREESKIVSLPVVVKDTPKIKSNLYLVELRGSLCMAQNLDDNSGTSIWSLVDIANQKWVQLFITTCLKRVVTSIVTDDSAKELVTVPESMLGNISYHNIISETVRKSEKLNGPFNWQPCLVFDSFFSFGGKTTIFEEMEHEHKTTY